MRSVAASAAFRHLSAGLLTFREQMAERATHHTRYAKKLNELASEDLIEAARHVANTLESPGWGFIVQMLQERRAELLEAMVGGGVRDHADYIARAAEARGIDQALDAGPTVLHKAETARKQLEQLGEAA